MKKRITLLLMALVMLVSVFAACGKKPEVKQNDEPIDYSKYPKTEIDGHQFDTAPVTLTAYMNSPKWISGGWGDDYVSKWITETTGVSIDIEYATTSTSEELNLKLASQSELPDFIVTDASGVVAKSLVQQKYALALDDLAKKYYPDFMELLPDKMAEIYSYDDGHLYNTADWFADTDRMLKLVEERDGKVAMSGGNQTICLNRSIWESMGSPAVDTLEQFKDYLISAKQKNPSIGIPFLLATTKWADSQDAVNMFYRLFGGADWLYDSGNGKIKMCITDPRYKQALKFMNDLYRAGVFNKETFSLGGDVMQTTLSTAKTIAYLGQDFNWFSKMKNGDKKGSVVLPIKPPMTQTLDREKDMSLKFTDISAIGGNNAVFITKDSKNKARAIQYLAFRYTDKAQIAERFGIEGKSWDKDPEDGTIVWREDLLEFQQEYGWSAMSEKYGPNNGVHSWFCTNYICKLESPKSDYYIRGYNYEINKAYMKNERIFDLTKIIKDDDMQMIYDQLVMVINESLTRCLLAASDSEFEKEFSNYVSKAKQSQMEKLEAYYSENYKKWKEKGL